MKKTRIIAMVLALVMTLALTGCGLMGKEDIKLLNCRVGEAVTLKADGKSYVARAEMPKGMAVDHWEINGEEIDSEGRVYSTRFTADFKGTLKAVLRPEKTVKCVNTYIQLLNEDGVPAGKEYTKFVFEYMYSNPDGTDHAGGTISFKVSAEIPKGYEVDYWIINGAPHYFDTNVRSFVVVGLDDSRTYEVVLKSAGSAGSAVSTAPDGGFTLELGDPPFGVEDEPDVPYGYYDDPNEDRPYGEEDEPFGPGNPDTEEREVPEDDYQSGEHGIPGGEDSDQPGDEPNTEPNTEPNDEPNTEPYYPPYYPPNDGGGDNGGGDNGGGDNGGGDTIIVEFPEGLDFPVFN